MEKSDTGIVAKKAANKGRSRPAELLEPSPVPEGKLENSNTVRARDRVAVEQGADRLRQFVKRKPKEQLTTLLHHITVKSLRHAFYRLKRKAAPGVDGVTWAEYEVGLTARLADLHDRVHSGAYRAMPSRRVEIPKPDGSTRPLGIAALEDKIVQAAVAICILLPIYEEEFLDFSYGFRYKRKAHDALDALAYAIGRTKVNWIVDADIRSFFDMVDQGWLIRFLEHRIADKRVIWLIIKWLKAGVMEAGVLRDSPMGTPQGAVISPILANVYLHYVLDLWYEKRWRVRVAWGETCLVRYADDFVVGFQRKHDAQRFLRDIGQRMAKFGLSLHPKKTRLLEFGRFAAVNRRSRGEDRPETFDFLGFTHYCRKTRRGRFGLGRKPVGKRMARKLKSLCQELRRRMHAPLHATAQWLGRVLGGWLNYYAVPTSFVFLRRFFTRLKREWMKVIRRRSQKDRMTWSKLETMVTWCWPALKIKHPWPDQRYVAMHAGATQGRSRMR